MKTFGVHIDQNPATGSVVRLKLIPAMRSSLREVLALMSAVLVAASIITLSVWATGMEIGAILGAGTWALGFVFLGFAVDGRGRTAIYQLLTGLALLVLALLQSYVSPDFFIFSGTLVATWLAAILLYRVWP